MSHALFNEVPIEIPMPEGMEEREDDVHDLQFGYDDDLDEDDRQGDSSHSQKNVVPEMNLIKDILVRQAEALEKLATGIQDISHALQQIAMILAPAPAPPNLPPLPPQVENTDAPRE